MATIIQKDDSVVPTNGTTCTQCPRTKPDDGHKMCSVCQDKIRPYARVAMARMHRKREKAIIRYLGNVCTKCSATDSLELVRKNREDKINPYPSRVLRMSLEQAMEYIDDYELRCTKDRHDD